MLMAHSHSMQVRLQCSLNSSARNRGRMPVPGSTSGPSPRGFSACVPAVYVLPDPVCP